MMLRTRLLSLALALGLGLLAPEVATATALEVGDLLVVDLGDNSLIRVDPDSGQQSVVVADGNFQVTTGVDTDANGQVVVSDFQSGILRIDPLTGDQDLLLDAAPGSGNALAPTRVAVGDDGIYMITDTLAGVYYYDPALDEIDDLASGGLLVSPTGLAFDGVDTLYVSDEGAQALLTVDAVSGVQDTLSSGGSLGQPTGVVVDAGGAIFVADYQNGVIEIDPANGAQTPLASGGTLQGVTGISLDLDGNLLVTDDVSKAVIRIDAQTGEELDVYSGGFFQQPWDVTVVTIAVPEPASTALGGATLLSLAWLARRRADGPRR